MNIFILSGVIVLTSLAVHLVNVFRNYRGLSDGRNGKYINAYILTSAALMIWFSIILPIFFVWRAPSYDQIHLFVIISSILIAKNASPKKYTVWSVSVAFIAIVGVVTAYLSAASGNVHVIVIPTAAIYALTLPLLALLLRSDKRIHVCFGVALIPALLIFEIIESIIYFVLIHSHSMTILDMILLLMALLLAAIALHALACLHPKAYVMAFRDGGAKNTIWLAVGLTAAFVLISAIATPMLENHIWRPRGNAGNHQTWDNNNTGSSNATTHEAARPASGNPRHLIWAHSQFPHSFGAPQLSSERCAPLIDLVFCRLFYIDADNNLDMGCILRGWSHQSYPYPDEGGELLLHVREGILFHDGHRLTADDIAFSLRIAFGKDTRIEVLGDYELVIHPGYCIDLFFTQLAHPSASIIRNTPENQLAIAANDWLHPIGTGPFMVSGIGDHNFIELIRFDQYHGNPPLLEKITINIIHDPWERASALYYRQADLASRVARDWKEWFEQNYNHTPVNTFVIPTQGIANIIEFNHQNAPFNDATVRWAIASIIGLSDILWQLDGNIAAIPAVGPVPPGGWYDMPQHDFWPILFAPETAADVLHETWERLGLDKRLHIVFNVWSESHVIIANAISYHLGNIGFDVAHYGLQGHDLQDRLIIGDFDMSIGGVYSSNPLDHLLRFHTDYPNNHTSFSRFSSPRIDLWIEVFWDIAHQSPSARRDVFINAQEALIEYMPAIWINQTTDIWAVGSGWQGFEPGPFGAHSIRRMFHN